MSDREDEALRVYLASYWWTSPPPRHPIDWDGNDTDDDPEPLAEAEAELKPETEDRA